MNMRDVKRRKQKRRWGGEAREGQTIHFFCLGGTRRNELHSLEIVGLDIYWLIIG